MLSQAIKASEKRKRLGDEDSTLFDITKVDNDFQHPPNPSGLVDYSIPPFYLLYDLMIICFPKGLSDFVKHYFIDDASTSKSKIITPLHSLGK